MRIEYDRKSDAACLYIEDPHREGQVKSTVEFRENIFLDFDADGKLMGVEILDASKNLTKTTLQSIPEGSSLS